MLTQLESGDRGYDVCQFSPAAHPDQCGFTDGKEDFFKGKNGDGVMEGQQKRALLISFLLCFFFPPPFLPCTKELCAQLSALPLFCV